MTNKEWIIQTVEKRVPGRVPFNFMYSPVARKLIEDHFNVNDIEKAYNFPIRMNSPWSIKPLYAKPAKFGPLVKDEFGVVWTTSDIDRGSPHEYPLSTDSLTGYKFPDPSAAYRFKELPAFCGNNWNNFTVIWVGDLWERATFMRGMENILVDVALNPEFVGALLDGLTDYILKTMDILFTRMEFDCIAVSDDYGSQRGMLMSPASWQELVKPRLKEIYALAKKHNKFIFHHSCGNLEPIIPDMIEIGLDILHPIQPEAMDIRKLKEEFGKDLCFCGGIRTQDLMPKGTPEEVREEVRVLKSEMGAEGGYILEPGITLQADVPVENLAAALEEAIK